MSRDDLGLGPYHEKPLASAKGAREDASESIRSNAVLQRLLPFLIDAVGRYVNHFRNENHNRAIRVAFLDSLMELHKLGIMAFVDLPLELLGDDVHASFLSLLWIGETLKDAFKDDLIEWQPPREKGLAAVYRPADVELLRDLLKPRDVGGVLVDGPDVSQDKVNEERALAFLGGLGEHALAFDVVIAPEALLKDGLVPFELF